MGVGSSERPAAYCVVLPPTAVLGFWNPNGSNADNNAASHTLPFGTLIYLWWINQLFRLSNPNTSTSFRFLRQGHWSLVSC